MVFWVGGGLEAFLGKPLGALSDDATVVALSDAAGVRLLATREGGIWEGQGDEEEHGEHEHEDAGQATTMGSSTCTCGSIRRTPQPWSARSRRR